MMHPAKKPVGYFVKDGTLVAILAHDKEEAAAAISRVAADWGVDPVSITPSPPPPSPTATGPLPMSVVYDRHLPPRDFKPKPWAGKGAATAVDGAQAFYSPAPIAAPPSPTGLPPSTPRLIPPADYSALIPVRPSE